LAILAESPFISKLRKTTNAKKSVHLTLGSLRKSQAVFYTLAFFWLDGFAVPTPAQVTQTVGHLTQKQLVTLISAALFARINN